MFVCLDFLLSERNQKAHQLSIQQLLHWQCAYSNIVVVAQKKKHKKKKHTAKVAVVVVRLWFERASCVV